MNCDPNSLMEAARCFRCIPQGMQSAVSTYLMCQWANAHVVPAPILEWTPHAAVVQWTEGGPLIAGDWDTFTATANKNMVDSIQADGVGLTSLTGLAQCPNLDLIIITNNPALSGTIDTSGLPLLDDFECAGDSFTSLDFSHNPLLTFVDCSGMGVLNTLNLTGCSILVGIQAGGNLLTNAGLIGFSCAATLFNCSLSGNLFTEFSVSGYASLDNLYIDNCLLAPPNGLDLTGCVSMSTLHCNSNLLTDLALPASPLLNDVTAHANLLNVASVDGVLSSLATNDLGLMGFCDLNTPATNASPTGGVLNPDYVALTGAGWTVSIN